MLTKVEAYTDQGDILTLSLEDPSTGYVISSIDGLDPVSATISSSSFGTIDGEQYQNSRRNKRNIIIKLDLMPDYSGTDARVLRTNLYNFFMPKTNTTLKFFIEGMDNVAITGMVESFEAPLFTQTPQATISILCFDPDFYNPVPISVPSTTSSAVSPNLVWNMIDYAGTVPTGIKLTMNVNRSLTEFSVIHYRPQDDVSNLLEFGWGAAILGTGETLKISTVPGDKYVRRIKSGVESSILYGIKPYSDYFSLLPGMNQIRVYAEGAPIPYTLEYVTRFGGL